MHALIHSVIHSFIHSWRWLGRRIDLQWMSIIQTVRTDTESQLLRGVIDYISGAIPERLIYSSFTRR